MASATGTHTSVSSAFSAEVSLALLSVVTNARLFAILSQPVSSTGFVPACVKVILINYKNLLGSWQRGRKSLISQWLLALCGHMNFLYYPSFRNILVDGMRDLFYSSVHFNLQ